MTHDDVHGVPGLNRRAALASTGAMAAGLALGSRIRGASAQDVSTQAHPLMGTWFLDNGTANPTDALDTFSLHADGTYIEANADGTVRLGAWEPRVP